MEQQALVRIDNRRSDAVYHDQRIGVWRDGFRQLGGEGFAGHMADFDEQRFAADGLAQSRGDETCQLRLLVKLAIGAGDIWAGKVCFHTVRAAFHGPPRALGKIVGEVIGGPMRLRGRDDGDGKDFVFRQSAARGFHISAPYLRRF